MDKRPIKACEKFAGLGKTILNVMRQIAFAYGNENIKQIKANKLRRYDC